MKKEHPIPLFECVLWVTEASSKFGAWRANGQGVSVEPRALVSHVTEMLVQRCVRVDSSWHAVSGAKLCGMMRPKLGLEV